MVERGGKYQNEKRGLVMLAAVPRLHESRVIDYAVGRTLIVGRLVDLYETRVPHYGYSDIITRFYIVRY